MATEVTVNGTTWNSDTSFAGYTYPGQLLAFAADVLADATQQMVTTSASSYTLGAGSGSITLAAELPVKAGAYFVLADTAAPTTNYALIQATSDASGTTLAFDEVAYWGSGTKTAWNLCPSGPRGPAGTLSGNASGDIDMAGNELVTDVSQFAVNAAGNSGTSTQTITKASKDLTTITATGDFTIDVTGGPDSGQVLSKRFRVTMDGTGARDITVQRESGSSDIYWPQNTADTTTALDTTAYGAGAILDLWFEDDGTRLVVHYELIYAGP